MVLNYHFRALLLSLFATPAIINAAPRKKYRIIRNFFTTGIIHCVIQAPVLATVIKNQGPAFPQTLDGIGLFGADMRIRTADPLITNEVLYQLSYTGIYVFDMSYYTLP